MAKCIAFANIKGGTGKTTTCINIAGHLARSNTVGPVLVVDFDPQAHATSGLGIETSSLEYSIYDAILEKCEGYSGVPITQIILETEVENLHLVPSELNLGTMPMIISQVKDKVGILNQVLEPIKSFYDLILIDTPSDSGLFMLNSLRAASEVVVPLDSSIFSLESLENLLSYSQDIEEIIGHSVNQFTLVLNRYIKSKRGTNKSPSAEIEEILEREPYPLFVIPESVLIYRSQAAGLPLSHYDPKSKISGVYQAIAKSLFRESE